MSDGTRIPLAEAQALANQVIEILRPHCDRIEVAGSIRRNKADVGDVEIVAVPKALYNLLCEVYRTDAHIENALWEAGYRFRRNGEKFKQFDLGPCNCDLFLTTPEQWGMIYTIRTGSADFTRRLVTLRKFGGLMPDDLAADCGRLVNRFTGQKFETPEEGDVFATMGLDWIDPDRRVA